MSTTFTASVENTEGKTVQYPYHLGTIERVARDCCVDILKRVTFGTIRTVALMRDHKIVDVLYSDGKWHNDIVDASFND